MFHYQLFYFILREELKELKTIYFEGEDHGLLTTEGMDLYAYIQRKKGIKTRETHLKKEIQRKEKE